MSVFYEILDAVKTRVDAVTGVPTPKLRKSVKLLPSDGTTFPIVFVCPNGPERVGLEAFTNKVSYEYPVVVAIIEDFNRQWEIDVSSMLETRELIRNALYQPTLTTVSGGIFDTNIEPLDPFFLDSEVPVHEVTGFAVVYKSLETRSA